MLIQLNQALLLCWMLINPVKLFRRINELEWYQHMLHSWITDLTIPARASVLELGCASGALTEYLAGNAYQATGRDASARMIKEANANPSRRATYKIADAQALPFADSSFDVLISASLINVVSEPERVIREMYRLCKPGGLISILVPKLGITQQHITRIIQNNCHNHFSAAALLTWHQRATKLDPEVMIKWFRIAGFEQLQQMDYLDGMVTTIRGVK